MENLLFLGVPILKHIRVIISDIQGAWLAQNVKPWPADLGVLSLIPPARINPFNPSRSFTAHSLLIPPPTVLIRLKYC